MKDMEKYNVEHLCEAKGVTSVEPVAGGYKVTSRTPMGHVMTLHISSVTSQSLLESLEDIDLNFEVVKGWQPYMDGGGTPLLYDNVAEHYADLLSWYENMLRTAHRMS